MKHMIKKLAAGLVLAVSASAHAQAPAPMPQPVTLNVGYVKVGHLASMLFVADELKKLNIEVKPVEFVRYADSRTALIGGSVDVSAVGPGDLAIAASQGSRNLIGLVGVAASPKKLVVRKGVTINDWKDIAGKKIGIAPGSAVWFQFAATMIEKGIPYNTFQEIKIQGGGTAFVQALKRGDIDAFVCWEPFESQVVADGTAVFADKVEYSQSKAVGAELGLIAASRTALEQKREAVSRFLWVYLQAEKRLAADKAAFADAYAKYTGLPIEVARDSVQLITLGGVINADQAAAQATAFHKLGVLQKDVSAEVRSLFDDSLARAAAR